MQRKLTLGFFLMASAVAVFVFVVGQRHIPVSTDESIIALQARHIASPPAETSIRRSIHPRPIYSRFPLLFMAQPYLFPLEAYIAAPVSRWLPAGPFGARIVPFLMGLLTLGLSFLILRRAGDWRRMWPGALLLVFPSTYVAMLQYGYMLPSYPSHMLFLALGVWLMMGYIDTPSLLRAGGIGVVCAAALAGQLMALPLALMCGVLIFWAGPGIKPRLLHSTLFAGLAATGWLPVAVVRKLYPGAYDAVSGSLPWREAIKRIPDPLLSHTLPVASGIQSTVFPDNLRHVELLPWLTRAWPSIWLGLLAAGLALWAWSVWRNRFRLERDPTQVFIMFFGLSVAAVFLFALSRRSHSHTYRYLLMAAWSLPFVIAYAHARLAWKPARLAVAGLAVFLTGLNAATLAGVMRHWATPEFAAEEASLYDTEPALKYLEEHGITSVYASYHLAYRLTYGSDERVTAAQYYNERFPGWPLPYKSHVDAAPGAGYVMAPRFAISADTFEAHLRETGLEYEKARVGALTLYHTFQWDRNGGWLSPDHLTLDASHSAERVQALRDGDPRSRWTAGTGPEPSMWVSLLWEEPLTVSALYLFYDFRRHDRPRTLAVDVWSDGGWIPHAEGLSTDLDPMLVDHGRPIYGNEFQRLEIPAATTTGLRIRVDTPADGRDWAIGEIRLWGERAEP